jgi:hypothetical protein
MFRDVVMRRGGIALDRGVLAELLREHVEGRADRSKILWAVFALRYWEQRSEAAPPVAADARLVAAA